MKIRGFLVRPAAEATQVYYCSRCRPGRQQDQVLFCTRFDLLRQPIRLAECFEHAIAAQLATGAGPQFERELFDYTYLLDHSLERQARSPEVQKMLQKVIAESSKNRNVDYEITRTAMNDTLLKAWKENAAKAGTLDDLTDWVVTYQTDGALVDQHRFERWQATKSIPWLLCVLVSMHAGDPHVAEVERAAAAIGADSPAYETALYHRVRLL